MIDGSHQLIRIHGTNVSILETILSYYYLKFYKAAKKETIAAVEKVGTGAGIDVEKQRFLLYNIRVI